MITDVLAKAFPTIGRLARTRLRCSFCGRRAEEVHRLVGGARAYICDACVAKCVAVLESHGPLPAGAKQ
jgi:hypothetical protein